MQNKERRCCKMNAAKTRETIIDNVGGARSRVRWTTRYVPTRGHHTGALDVSRHDSMYCGVIKPTSRPLLTSACLEANLRAADMARRGQGYRINAFLSNRR